MLKRKSGWFTANFVLDLQLNCVAVAIFVVKSHNFKHRRHSGPFPKRVTIHPSALPVMTTSSILRSLAKNVTKVSSSCIHSQVSVRAFSAVFSRHRVPFSSPRSPRVHHIPLTIYPSISECPWQSLCGYFSNSL